MSDVMGMSDVVVMGIDIPSLYATVGSLTDSVGS